MNFHEQRYQLKSTGLEPDEETKKEVLSINEED